MKKTTLWQIFSLILGALLVVSIITHGFKGKGSTDTGPTGAAVSDLNGKGIVLNDKRCGGECDTTTLLKSVKEALPGVEFIELNYSSKEGKDIYGKSGVQFLPAILFDSSIEKNSGYANIQQFIEEKNGYLSLRLGSTFDPAAEICDNSIDDNGDKLIDCQDPTCQKEWKCMPKKDKVDVDLFVMSHCPYGTQIEKGILPVVNLLGDDINFNVRFVYYAMHGRTEIDEELLQHCIQKEYKGNYLDYLGCFLKEGNSEECLGEVKLTGKLDSCIKEVDGEFKAMENYNDQSTWLNGKFPLFDVDKELNEKYKVGGSPTLVINGAVASTGRDPQSLLNAICTGFKEKPEECMQTLSSTAPAPGFGFEGNSTATGSCT